MGWRIPVAWWVVFCINYSKLLEAYHQKAGDSGRQSINTNMPIRQQNWELNYIQDWDLILYWTSTSRTIKLLRSGEKIITKDKNGENGF